MKHWKWLPLALCAMCLSASAQQYVFAAGGNSNIRSGPGLSFDKESVLIVNTTATYLGETSIDDRGVAWYKILYGETQGWVSSKYVELIYEASENEPSYDEETEELVSASLGTVEASVDAQICVYPGDTDGSIGTIPAGGTANWEGETESDLSGTDWYSVKYGDQIGWVSSEQTLLYPGENVPSVDPAELNMEEDTVSESSVYGSIVYASEGNTRIRSMPSLSGEVLGFLDRGQSATYLGESSVDNRGVTWYYVSKGGVNGWVSERYTTMY